MQLFRYLAPPALLLIVTACSPPDSEAGGSEAAEPETPAEVATLVETVTVQETSFSETIVLTGETSPVRAANLSSQIPGRIVALDVVEGQAVSEGDRVLRIDTSTVGSQRAQLETQRDALGRDILRAEQLLNRGLATQTDLQSVQTQQEIVIEQIAAIDTSVYQGRSRAPISGIVVSTMAEEGEFANPGVPLARIIDISTIVVNVGLPEREISFVREGMSVPVQVLATGQNFTGTLHRIGLEANPANRTFPLEIHIANPDNEVRAGMRTVVELPKRSFENVVVVPSDAILQGIDGPEVLVAEGGVAALRRLELGPGRGGFQVVRSGLNAGDVLVVRGHRLLVPRENIRTVDLGPCCHEQFQNAMRGGTERVGSAAEGG
ncbi:MAG: RND family efflux transporter MFP subunit [Bradymonadia bacterium]|jgi:RND family efflux transporter MFP subunit